MPGPELASGGAPASGGPSVVELAASGVAGGSDAGGSDAGSLSSLDAVRAMQVVSSRLSSVPEHREIDSPAHRKIDSQDLPEFGALVEATREVDRCLAHCTYLRAAESVEDFLALGATACPEGGEVAARNKFRT